MDLRYAKRGKEMLSYGSQWRSGLRLGLGFNCLSLFSRLGFSVPVVVGVESSGAVI